MILMEALTSKGREVIAFLKTGPKYRFAAKLIGLNVVMLLRKLFTLLQYMDKNILIKPLKKPLTNT